MKRIRRGTEVIIPEKWVGNFTTKKTIRQRQSKLTKKLRRQLKQFKPRYIPNE